MEFMIKILVIDDEASIRNIIVLSLQAQGYETFEAASVSEGIRSVIDLHPHLIILDLGLPDGSGRDVLKNIREWSQVPIIVLTVDDSELNKVALLEAGADDYMTKPFGVPELIARIKVAFRHAQTENATPIFQSNKLKVDLSKHEVFINEKEVHLTATEYEILRLLVRNGGQVISQEHLLSEIWGPLGLENPHYIRIYIGQLRKKIEEDPSMPKHIITESGVGYRIR
jgi:two-component system KDP operon response regulator KdpE